MNKAAINKKILDEVKNITAPGGIKRDAVSDIFLNILNLINITFVEDIIVLDQVAIGQRKTLTIPEGVYKIASEAFVGHGITDIEFPKSLYDLGEDCFASNVLHKGFGVTIPKTIKKIGVDAFRNNMIESINLEEGLEELNGFSDNEIANLVLPSSLLKVNGGAFHRNSLEQINLNQIAIIGDRIRDKGAFSNNKLEEITFSENLTFIGSGAFRYNNLTELILPDRLEVIGESAFSHNKIASIIFPKSILYIDSGAFSFNPPLERVDIPLGCNVHPEAFAESVIINYV